MNKKGSFIYLNGEFYRSTKCKISIFDRGFQFGDGVYEVAMCYNGKIFFLKEHLVRLENSLKHLQIKTSAIDFEEISRQLIAKNDLTEETATIYIQITRGVAPRKHYFPDPPVEPTVLIMCSPFTLNKDAYSNGAKTITTEDCRWSKCFIKSTSLLPNVLANQYAKDNYCYESLFVSDNDITEGTHTSFFGVRNNKLFTHPTNGRILDGITRRIVFNIASENSIELVEEAVKLDEIKSYDEFFLCGTTVEITPIIKIDDHIIGDNKPGPLTKFIQNKFEEIKKGH